MTINTRDTTTITTTITITITTNFAIMATCMATTISFHFNLKKILYYNLYIFINFLKRILKIVNFKSTI